MKTNNEHNFDSHALPPFSQQNCINLSVWNQFDESLSQADPRAASPGGFEPPYLLKKSLNFNTLF